MKRKGKNSPRSKKRIYKKSQNLKGKQNFTLYDFSKMSRKSWFNPESKMGTTSSVTAASVDPTMEGQKGIEEGVEMREMSIQDGPRQGRSMENEEWRERERERDRR